MHIRTKQLSFAAALWIPMGIVVACSGGDDDIAPDPSEIRTVGDVDPSELPDDSELRVEDLGSVSLSDTGGYIDLAVTVPEGAVSTLAHCGGWGDQGLGAIWMLQDAASTLVYDGNAPDTTRFRSDFLDDMSPAMVPITPNLDISPGTWNFQWFVGAGNDTTASCGVVHKVDEVPTNANVWVRLVFVGLDLTAANALDDTAFTDVLLQFQAEWATAGLFPIYEFVDFAGDVARFTVVDVADDDYTEFNDLLRTTNPSQDRAITFFLVEEVANSSAGGATILGLSSGPPGAAAVHGTSKSGVIVSAVDYDAAPSDVAKIMAHEGGHFMGLYHTTEKAGDQSDPLGDTPECPIANDTNGNGTVNSDECAGAGAENVMWWTLTSGDASMSADQGWVVRRNPVAD